MSIWVNPTTSSASKTILGKAEEFRIFTNASGFVGCQIKTTTWQSAAQATTRALALSTWSHVVCTYDLTNLKVYVNGVNVATQTLSSLPDDTANALKIGQDDSASTPYGNLAGTIDEFKFYSYALTADEVKKDYNQGSAMVLGNRSANDINNPPVAEWNFEEGTGSTVNDSSGNNNTGTWNGTGSHWAAAKNGMAGKFNGADDYVSQPLKLGSAGTVSFWLNPTHTAGTAIEYFFGSYDSVGNYFTLQNWNNGNSYWGWFTGGVEKRIITSSAFPSGWFYVTFTWDTSTGLSTLYWNGIQKGQTTGLSSVYSMAYAPDIMALNTSGSHANQAAGLIDQVRVYNYARTPAQVAWDYNRGAPVGWWKMDECQGATIHDSSGNSNNGTVTVGPLGSQASLGTCAANAATAWYNGKSGKRNASLNFDGTDDYVQIPDNSSLNVTPYVSVAAWIKRGATGVRQEIYSKIQTGVGGFEFWITSGNLVYFSYITSTGASGNDNGLGTISDTSWHHVVKTYDGSNIKTYIDGKYIGSVARSITIGTNNSPARIGTHSVDAYLLSWPFKGQIDDVRIYNYALTATQIKTLYNENSAVRYGP